ncbi:MAG: class I SAM-dependent methyltransferase [Sphingobium sp.]|nr:class I SAM-dependent methyltransferase [Sphingobium sp.]
MRIALLSAGAALTLAIAAPLLAQAVSPLVTAAMADPGRPEADKVRDADRKPAELIAFAGVKEGSRVAEIAPGGGYFTRLLTGAVGAKGKVYAMTGRPTPALTEFAAAHPSLTIIANPPGEINAPEPVDVVWTTLNYHDFKNNKVGETDMAGLINAAAFKALKPGGLYLVVDHQAAPGAGTTVTSTMHRIEDAAVKKEVEAAGFKLDAQSPLLRHAEDDHSQGVRETGVRGKTDQFVLRFRKPS